MSALHLLMGGFVLFIGAIIGVTKLIIEKKEI